MKYIVSYKTKFGTVSAESDQVGDLVSRYASLKSLAEKLESASKGDVANHPEGRVRLRTGSSRNSLRGRGETTSIIRIIESRLISSSFFSRPKSTGETKDKVDLVSRKKHTSRKVSQALGILWKKGVLKRSGSRNYYFYSK